MSRSQKAYTIVQYNKQRSAKGFPPIPNPFAKDGSSIRLNQDGTETITERTPGKPLIQDIGDKYRHDQVRSGPLLETFNRNREAAEIAHLEEFFNSAEGQAIIDQLVEVNNRNELANFS